MHKESMVCIPKIQVHDISTTSYRRTLVLAKMVPFGNVGGGIACSLFLDPTDTLGDDGLSTPLLLKCMDSLHLEHFLFVSPQRVV